MLRWRVSYFGKTGQILGHVDAKDADAACREEIEFYDVPQEQQFRVVAVKIEEAKRPRVKS